MLTVAVSCQVGAKTTLNVDHLNHALRVPVCLCRHLSVSGMTIVVIGSSASLAFVFPEQAVLRIEIVRTVNVASVVNVYQRNLSVKRI